MILDSRVEFADATSVAAAAGTALIGNVVDLGTGGSTSPGPITDVDDLYFILNVDTEIFTASAAGTVKFQLVSDAQAAIAVDGSATVHFDSGTFATGATGSNAKLLAGKYLVRVEVPRSSVNPYERFLGVLAITATTTTTSGKINAFLSTDPSTWVAYQDAVN